MIVFDLSCPSDHRFEGWFRDREDFDAQLGRGLVACPLCGSTEVARRPSPVAVHVSRRSTASAPAPSPETGPAPARPPAGTVPAKPFLQALTRFIEEHFEDVGPSFAEEARRMDKGESDPRNIRGTTTPEEEEALEEEGIAFLKVPVPKYDA